VTNGMISRSDKIRVIRDGIVIYPTKEGVQGDIATLKRFKDDVKEVLVKNFNDIKEGDVLECYEIIEIRQTLD